jgi:hypothetical protein
MRPTAPEQFRQREWESRLYGDCTGKRCGCFTVPLPNRGHKVLANCILSDGSEPGTAPEIRGWEHVSVHIEEYGRLRTPTWAEMCAVKEVFWDDAELVVQYHPPKAEWVNCHPHVLHLWSCRNQPFPRPPRICV